MRLKPRRTPALAPQAARFAHNAELRIIGRDTPVSLLLFRHTGTSFCADVWISLELDSIC
jgi:hypothetical protein